MDKETQSDKTTITTTINRTLLRRFKVFCAQEGRNMNFYIERWIDQELKKQGN